MERRRNKSWIRTRAEDEDDEEKDEETRVVPKVEEEEHEDDDEEEEEEDNSETRRASGWWRRRRTEGRKRSKVEVKEKDKHEDRRSSAEILAATKLFVRVVNDEEYQDGDVTTEGKNNGTQEEELEQVVAEPNLASFYREMHQVNNETRFPDPSPLVRDDVRDTSVSYLESAEAKGFMLNPNALSAMVLERDYEFLGSYGGGRGLTRALGSNIDDGLQANFDFATRQSLWGSNDVLYMPTSPLRSFIWEGFQDVYMFLLGIGAFFILILAATAKDEEGNWSSWTEGLTLWILIVLILLGKSSLNWYNASEYERLQLELESRNKVEVIRSGEVVLMHPENLVVGDILVINQGDVIEADCVLLEGTHVTVNESSLREGGFAKVAKQPASSHMHAMLDNDSDMSYSVPSEMDGNCFLMSGTWVINGHGKALVVAVGRYSQRSRMNVPGSDISVEEATVLSWIRKTRFWLPMDFVAATMGNRPSAPSPSRNGSMEEIDNASVMDLGISVSQQNIKAGPVEKIDQEHEVMPLSSEMTITEYLKYVVGRMGTVGIGLGLFCFVGALCVWLARGLYGRGNDIGLALIHFYLVSLLVVIVCKPNIVRFATIMSLVRTASSMSRANSHVRNLSGCETMGRVTTIFCDKTGTLTQNKPQVVVAYLGLSMFTKGKETPNLAQAILRSDQPPPREFLELVVESISLNCSPYTTLPESEQKDDRSFKGSATEASLLRFVTELGYDYSKIRLSPRFRNLDVNESGLPWGIVQFPFRAERNRMSWVVHHPQASMNEAGDTFSSDDEESDPRDEDRVVPIVDDDDEEKGNRDAGDGTTENFRDGTGGLSKLRKFFSKGFRFTKRSVLGSYRYRIHSKGAPNIILESCTHYISAMDGQVHRLDENARGRFKIKIKQYEDAGLRTIALAYRDFFDPPKQGWFTPANHRSNTRRSKSHRNLLESDAGGMDLVDAATESAATDYTAYERLITTTRQFEVEIDMILIAIFGIDDPLHMGVREAVERCHNAGIDIKLCTGDSLRAANTIAQEAGIISKNVVTDSIAPVQGDVAMTGAEFNERVFYVDQTQPQVLRRTYNPDTRESVFAFRHPFAVDEHGNRIWNTSEFGKLWPNLKILARCLPEDKLALVRGVRHLQRSEVLAVTARRSSDIELLKEANVGLAIGSDAVGIGKRTADITLFDRSFQAIFEAVKWGRTVFTNIKAVVQFQFTMISAAILLVFISIFAFNTSVLGPSQLLWINFGIGSVGIFAFIFMAPNRELHRGSTIVTDIIIFNIVGHVLFQIVVLSIVLSSPELIPRAGTVQMHQPGTISSLHFTYTFNAFVLMNIFNMPNARRILSEEQVKRGLSSEWNVFQDITDDGVFVLFVLVAIMMQIIIVQSGGAGFRIVYAGLDARQWVSCFLLGLFVLLWQQVINLCLYQYYSSAKKPYDDDDDDYDDYDDDDFVD